MRWDDRRGGSTARGSNCYPIFVMALDPKTLEEFLALPFDDVIDVRSPSEFAEDHIPGAVNLPVLTDDERATVGTIYVQESKFRARKIGAALVAENAARHLKTYLADKPGGYKPLVYCWRGGQRSGSFATILKQVGWPVEVMAGGYRSFRRLVVDTTHHQPFPAPVVILEGNTGTAKTAILNRARDLGVQVIDLEAAANHRGSLFGGMSTPQPSQKTFEARVGLATAGLDPLRPVVVESESNKIGNRTIPPMLWDAMRHAPRIRIEAPLAARAKYLTQAYRDIVENNKLLVEVINRLRPYQSGETIEAWLKLADAGQFEALATDLMARHYDSRYAKHRARMNVTVVETIEVGDLGDADLDKAAHRLADIIGDGLPTHSSAKPLVQA